MKQGDAGVYRTGIERVASVIVSTGNDIGGHKITNYLGIVRGLVVRATSIGQGFVGSLRSLAGGNVPEYTRVCEAARHEAYLEMVKHAELLEAHAIIGMRYDATEFMPGSTEVLAYGTAVRIAAI